MSIDIEFLSEEVLSAAGLRMPFGKFEGTRLIDLPEPYVVWFKQQGYPKGRLGQQMALIYEIKANGLEKLIRPLLETVPSNESDGRSDGGSDETVRTHRSSKSDGKAP